MNLTADHGPGTLYMLCFSEPYTGRPSRPDARPQAVRHYIGIAPVTLAGRLAAHRSGNGARLVSVVMAAGISWKLARTWPPEPGRERKLKNRKNARKMCPKYSPNAGIGKGNWKRAGRSGEES